MTNTANSLLAGLNDKQLEAVTLPQQSALILAGAGKDQGGLLRQGNGFELLVVETGEKGIGGVGHRC